MDNHFRENCDCNHMAENHLCANCHECIFDVKIDDNIYTVFITTCRECSDGDRFGWTPHEDNKSPEHSLDTIREKAREELENNPELYDTNCGCDD